MLDPSALNEEILENLPTNLFNIDEEIHELLHKEGSPSQGGNHGQAMLCLQESSD